MSQLKIETHRLQAGDGIPNNRFPLVVYRGALSGGSDDRDVAAGGRALVADHAA